MQFTGPTKRLKVAVLTLSCIMFLSFLVLGQTSDAGALSSSPCPHYSIQDVFDDPKGNWDSDQVNNADELYNGLNPCIVDTNAFCAGGGNPLCIYPVYVYVPYASACQTSIDSFPNADYDGDGISNAEEVRNGANPCTHPCPNPRGVDIALNPNGSWDSDGISNALEVNQGTNPCDGYRYNPCPYYSTYQVQQMASLDWDGDGVTNAAERLRGTNPCVFNVVQRLPHVTKQVPKKLPHVTTVYVAPAPRPVAVCPVNYPYYHRGNGLCYANPVVRNNWQ